MPKYLSLSEWRIASSFGPSVVLEHVQRIDTEMGFSAGTYARFEQWENEAADDVDNALRRRYAVPFAIINGAVDITKVPRTVKKWVRLLLDVKLLDARRAAGVEGPDDSSIAGYKDDVDAEMAKAANDKDPHPELPLRSDLPSSSGIEKGGPFVVEYLQGSDVWDALAARRYL